VWHFKTSNLKDADVGAPPTISAPGRNGFAGGVVYVTGKDKVVYAINLTTGKLIWSHNLAAGTNGDLSGAALVGNRVYVGSDKGIYAFNATTGALVWHVLSGSVFYASPAVTGPAGKQILVIGSNEGVLYALNLATGKTVWTRQPSKKGFWASPAVSQGAFYVAGLDGVLRSYAPRS
jgi:outer membrane protein assembly factor BamB